jgi:hypothetical protein
MMYPEQKKNTNLPASSHTHVLATLQLLRGCVTCRKRGDLVDLVDLRMQKVLGVLHIGAKMHDNLFHRVGGKPAPPLMFIIIKPFLVAAVASLHPTFDSGVRLPR